MLLLDADSHYYEPLDCCTRHIEPEFRDRTVRTIRTDEGEKLFVGNQVLTYLGINPLVGVPPAGAFEAFFTKGKSNEDLLRAGMVDPRQIPEYEQREPRLKLMEEQELDGLLMLPTLGVTFEYQLRHDLPAHAASITAFNKWLEEDWGYGEDGKVWGVPLLSLEDLPAALKELDRVIARGTKFVLLRCGPVHGRSPADPFFDPFWARCNEAEIAVVFHVGNDGFVDIYANHWGEDPTVSLGKYSPFQMYTSQGDRPIADTLAALVLHNLFGRFPKVKAITVENGSEWVPALLHDMDKAIRKGRLGKQLGGPVTEVPSDIFKQHVFVQPFYEDDVINLVNTIGPERVLFGSDFPHPEGLADPKSFVKVLDGLPQKSIEQIMGGNLAGLFGIDVPEAVGA